MTSKKISLDENKKKTTPKTKLKTKINKTTDETKTKKRKVRTKAVIFELDGTLVKTEKLKAISYAQAAVKL